MAIYEYGPQSRENLETVHPTLEQVFDRVLELALIDVTITEGVRSKEVQDEHYRAGRSRVKWPNSKHNVLEPGQKSLAVDAAPYVNGRASYNWRHCIYLAGVVQATARLMGAEIRWGGNWDRDGEPVTDQEFQDLVHYELVQ
jgi:peptidoglycan L-alanyl-D-glutamate endopeptidase CwlK